MNGFIKKVMAAGTVSAVVWPLAGCSNSYSDLVDQCWPQRWTSVAREEVREPLGTQADNGLFLEQTLWNHHFVEGTPNLTPGGQAVLNRLARRRPEPIPELYVQTAHDITYDAAKKPEVFGKDRSKLDIERTEAVRNYLAAVKPDVMFRVGIHDPSPVGMSGREASRRKENATTAEARGTVQTQAEQARRDIRDEKRDEKRDVQTRQDIDVKREPEKTEP